MPQLSRHLLAEFIELARAEAGLELGADKESLVASRLAKRMRTLGLDSYADYHARLTGPEGGEEREWFINALTTNVTAFFREPEAFAALSDQLRASVQRGEWRFRIWCAASSTGEEPWSLAMAAREALGPSVDLRILATDIDTQALAKASAGVYPEDRMRPVSPSRRERWFERHPEGWAVAPELRELVTFARVNLAAPPFRMRGPFQAIFCRNVMIYFGRTVRQAILDEVDRLLGPQGLFAIGRSEGLSGMDSPLHYVAPAVYGRVARQRGAA